MQTFLPCVDFKETFSCLDRQRLGKQRVEAMQIYNIIAGKTNKKGWINHPAVLMWIGFENALALYHNLCISEWINRGYKNNMSLICVDFNNLIMPKWVNDIFCSYHRGTLLHKNYDWYSQFGWKEEPKYEYLWPTKI